jgi:hypothetical protein
MVCQRNSSHTDFRLESKRQLAFAVLTKPEKLNVTGRSLCRCRFVGGGGHRHSEQPSLMEITKAIEAGGIGALRKHFCPLAGESAMNNRTLAQMPVLGLKLPKMPFHICKVMFLKSYLPCGGLHPIGRF